MPTEATNLQNIASTAVSLPSAGPTRKTANSAGFGQDTFDSALNQARSASANPGALTSPAKAPAGKSSQKTAGKTGSGKGQAKDKSAGNLPRGSQTLVAGPVIPSAKSPVALADQQSDENLQQDAEESASTAQAQILKVSSAAQLAVIAARKDSEPSKTPGDTSAPVEPRTPKATTAGKQAVASASKTTDATDATEDEESSQQDAVSEEDSAALVEQSQAQTAAPQKPERHTPIALAGAAQAAARSAGANANAGKDSTSVDSVTGAAAAAAGQSSDATATNVPTSAGDAKTAVHGAVAIDADASVVETANSAASLAPGNVHAPVATTPAAGANTTPEARFAQDNHPLIVTGVTGQLLPHGGTMEIQLTPPDIGALHIRVDMQNGVMNATFQTSNDDATQLLTHSLSQLKGALESQGLSVDKLQVQQLPRETRSGQQEESSRQQQGSDGDNDATQEQQRRQLLQRMWSRLAKGEQDLDLVA